MGGMAELRRAGQGARIDAAAGVAAVWASHLLPRDGGVMEVEGEAAEAAGGRLPVIGNGSDEVTARDFGQHVLAHLQGADAEAREEEPPRRWAEFLDGLACDFCQLTFKCFLLLGGNSSSIVRGMFNLQIERQILLSACSKEVNK
jgi:hypothetical protein